MKPSTKSITTQEASPPGETVECMDLLLPKMGELVGGSLRQDDPQALLSSLNSHNLDPKLYDWYVDLRSFGSVPHGGFGMGLERYLAYVTGMWNLKDWVLAPRYLGHCRY
jgi:asparaginyl-tRNA synthetase